MPYAIARLLSAIVLSVASFSPAVAVTAAPPDGVIRIEEDAIRVEHAWARASAGNATTGAAYVTLVGGAQPDRLIGVSTDAAETAQVHESMIDNGVMKMRPVPGLPIPAGGTVTLAPGGYHIMMTGLKQPLLAGHSFLLTLHFEHAPPIHVDVHVRGIGQAAPTSSSPDGHDQMHM